MPPAYPFAIPFPDISPEIFAIEIGPLTLALRWYALAYIVALLLGWRLVAALMRRPWLWPEGRAPMRPGETESLLTWVILGVLLGGRLGFVLFYQPGYYLSNPGEIIAIWEGGMSFHGGALGVLTVIVLWCWRSGAPMSGTFDALALVTPIGLFLGRIANFINAELWGRPTQAPWGVIFPGSRAQDCPGWPEPCARHPSQLYEAGLEGLLLGLVLAVLALRLGGLRRPWLITGVFVAGYGAARSVVELFRHADAQFVGPGNPWGHVLRLGTGPEAWGLTMGQLLSLPMAIAGIVVIVLALPRRVR